MSRTLDYILTLTEAKARCKMADANMDVRPNDKATVKSWREAQRDLLDIKTEIVVELMAVSEGLIGSGALMEMLDKPNFVEMINSVMSHHETFDDKEMNWEEIRRDMQSKDMNLLVFLDDAAAEQYHQNERMSLEKIGE